jgi:uncharacterized integral membrane protein (TIGR00697 family)
MNKEIHKKNQNLFIILGAFFIGNALIAELLGVKIFSAGQIFDIKPFKLFGNINFDYNMSVGTIIWPFVFIISDLINEYFGRKGVKQISFITAFLIAYAYIIIIIGTSLPPAQFWLDLNNIDNNGNNLNIDHAYSVIFRQSSGIIIGSITAFLISQLIDAYIFYYVRKTTGHKALWLRATGSTVISQIFDSFIVLFVAFYFLGNWNIKQVAEVAIIQYIYKVALAIALTPLIYIIHFIIDLYFKKQQVITK